MFFLYVVPGQPMNFRAEAKSETSISLTWSPPRQDSIVKYEVIYKEGEKGPEVGREWL